MTDFSNIEPPRKTLGKLGAVIFVIVFIGVIGIGAMITMTMFSTFGATVSSFKTAQEEALTTPGAVVLENGIYIIIIPQTTVNWFFPAHKKEPVQPQ